MTCHYGYMDLTKTHTKKGVKKTMTNKITREQWLQDANSIMRQGLFKQHGYDLPEDVQVSAGFPLGFRAGAKKQTVGQCFPRSLSKAGVNEIFINPTQSDTLEVLGILVHEDIHSIDDCKNGHGKVFKDMAIAVGLEGQMRSTTSSQRLIQYFKEEIISKIGEYPHKETTAPTNGKKQGTRMIKVSCANDCGFQFYTSQKQLDNIRYTDCNGCGDSGLNIHYKDETIRI